MQQMQVQVPAGVGPGMGFMVAGPDGSQFQVQCPPDAKEGMMITVAVPTPAVAVAQPMMMAQQPVGFGQQMAQMNVPPGNTFLLGIHGLYVRQALEVVEMLTDCETKNRYSFTPIPLGTPIPAAPDSSMSARLAAASLASRRKSLGTMCIVSAAMCSFWSEKTSTRARSRSSTIACSTVGPR